MEYNALTKRIVVGHLGLIYDIVKTTRSGKLWMEDGPEGAAFRKADAKTEIGLYRAVCRLVEGGVVVRSVGPMSLTAVIPILSAGDIAAIVRENMTEEEAFDHSMDGHDAKDCMLCDLEKMSQLS